MTTATKPYIGGAEVDALIARRDAIVALFEKLIAERGRNASCIELTIRS